MAPALSDGDIVLVRTGATPQPGDVVIVSWPQRPEQLSIKRAAWPDGAGWFVVGDNWPESTDSNTLGPATVHGVIYWRLWPRPRRVAAL
jgi:phage repressor protein C with HTH and peptisase S24 domain